MTTPAYLRALMTGVSVMDATPAGIQASEKRGQTALVNSTNMPAKMRPSRQAFENAGFVFGEPVDDIFVSATLPAGWARKATEHDMHSEILDETGKVRVSVFYKAAFYDRRADATLLSEADTDA